MDQIVNDAERDQADALRVAGWLGGSIPLFSPVLREAQAFWSPDLPPATVLLGELGQAFAAAFHMLGAEDRATVAHIVETAMDGSDYVSTAVATGFLEAAIHRAEADGAWPDVAAVLGPQSLAFAEAYRSHPFHGMEAEAAAVPDDRAPGMGM